MPVYVIFSLVRGRALRQAAESTGSDVAVKEAGSVPRGIGGFPQN